MTRPAGVTASAVVALLGSLLTLLFGGLMVFAAFTVSQQPAPPRAVVLVGAAVTIGFAALGIATTIGLFRLREWARISMLVFGAIMGGISLLSVIVMAIIPLPPTPGSAISAQTMRTILVGVYVIPVLIGVWWVVQFNRPSTKAAFAAGTTGEPSRRPLSVSIIGWWMLIGGILTVTPALIGMPLFAAGVVLTGWGARLGYVLFAVVSAYLGWGLLKLQERVRQLTIGWFGLTTAHVLYVVISPHARERMRDAQAMFQADFTPRSGPNVPVNLGDMTSFTLIVMSISVLLIGVAIWFLVRAKPAFQAPVAQ